MSVTKTFFYLIVWYQVYNVHFVQFVTMAAFTGICKAYTYYINLMSTLINHSKSEIFHKQKKIFSTIQDGFENFLLRHYSTTAMKLLYNAREILKFVRKRVET